MGLQRRSGGRRRRRKDADHGLSRQGEPVPSRFALRLLFVTYPGSAPSPTHRMRWRSNPVDPYNVWLDPATSATYRIKWRTRMKLIMITELNRYTRAVNTIAKYAEAGAKLGHEVVVFSEQ